MAGPLPDEVVEEVTRLANDSPFMASAVLRGLVESGNLVRERDGWKITRPLQEEVQSSERAAGFLTRRLELLPPETLQLISTGAILGKEFELDIAASLAGQTSQQAIAALRVARQRHLVWLRRMDRGVSLSTTRSAPPCSIGIPRRIADGCMNVSPVISRSMSQTARRTSRITLTQPVTPGPPCLTRCRQHNRLALNTRLRRQNNSI